MDFNKVYIRIYSKENEFLQHSFIGVLLKEDIKNQLSDLSQTYITQLMSIKDIVRARIKSLSDTRTIYLKISEKNEGVLLSKQNDNYLVS